MLARYGDEPHEYASFELRSMFYAELNGDYGDALQEGYRLSIEKYFTIEEREATSLRLIKAWEDIQALTEEEERNHRYFQAREEVIERTLAGLGEEEVDDSLWLRLVYSLIREYRPFLIELGYSFTLRVEVKEGRGRIWIERNLAEDNEVVKEWGDSLPLEALIALCQGGEWKDLPPDTEGFVSVPIYFPRYDTWTKESFGYGIEIEDKKVFFVDLSVDQEGNWDEEREEVTNSDELVEKIYQMMDSTDSDRYWREYVEWVAEKGIDPLGEFYVERKEEQEWQFFFASWIGASRHGLLFQGASPVGTEEGVIISPMYLPQAVLDFACATKLNSLWVCPDFAATADLPTDDEGKVVGKVQMPRSQEEIAKEISAKAKEFLCKQEQEQEQEQEQGQEQDAEVRGKEEG